jgi:hypothetical protein
VQLILVTIVLSLATLYLAREFYKRFLSKDTKCDGCAVNKLKG